MKELKQLNKYFWKYRWRLTLGFIFILLSNYFGILAPQMTGFVVDEVQRAINPVAMPSEKVFLILWSGGALAYSKTLGLNFHNW